MLAHGGACLRTCPPDGTIIALRPAPRTFAPSFVLEILKFPTPFCSAFLIRGELLEEVRPALLVILVQLLDALPRARLQCHCTVVAPLCPAHPRRQRRWVFMLAPLMLGGITGCVCRLHGWVLRVKPLPRELFDECHLVIPALAQLGRVRRALARSASAVRAISIAAIDVVRTACAICLHGPSIAHGLILNRAAVGVLRSAAPAVGPAALHEAESICLHISLPNAARCRSRRRGGAPRSIRPALTRPGRCRLPARCATSGGLGVGRLGREASSWHPERGRDVPLGRWSRGPRAKARGTDAARCEPAAASAVVPMPRRSPRFATVEAPCAPLEIGEKAAGGAAPIVAAPGSPSTRLAAAVTCCMPAARAGFGGIATTRSAASAGRLPASAVLHAAVDDIHDLLKNLCVGAASGIAAPRHRRCSAATPAAVMGSDAPAGGFNRQQGAVGLPLPPGPPMPRLLARRDDHNDDGRKPARRRSAARRGAEARTEGCPRRALAARNGGGRGTGREPRDEESAWRLEGTRHRIAVTDRAWRARATPRARPPPTPRGPIRL